MSSNSDELDKSPSTSSENHHTGACSAGKYYNRGLEYHRAGRFEEAQADYRHALQLQAEHADALHMLGVIAYQGGRYDEAATLITRAAGLMSPNAGVHINLGNVLQAREQVDEAVAEFRSAIRLDPGNAVAHNNLGNALRLQGKKEIAVESFKKALAIDNGYIDAHVNLAIAYQSMGDDTRAATSYENAVKLDPDNKPAAHMLAALRGEDTDGAPPEHVEKLFDDYATRFDHHLVDTLGYSMPDELRREIDLQLGRDACFPDAIDLGCGTGLMGVAFNNICGRLVGIDLSARMIDRAMERGVYDDLRVGEVVGRLEADQNHYDLFLCADVFPYIGNVRPLFSTVRNHSRDGALFAFSTELEAEADYILRPSGRYAHSQRYLRAVSAEYGFSVMTMRTENLRKQKGKWISGDLVVLRYQG